MSEVRREAREIIERMYAEEPGLELSAFAIRAADRRFGENVEDRILWDIVEQMVMSDYAVFMREYESRERGPLAPVDAEFVVQELGIPESGIFFYRALLASL